MWKDLYTKRCFTEMRFVLAAGQFPIQHCLCASWKQEKRKMFKCNRRLKIGECVKQKSIVQKQDGTGMWSEVLAEENAASRLFVCWSVS